MEIAELSVFVERLHVSELTPTQQARELSPIQVHFFIEFRHRRAVCVVRHLCKRYASQFFSQQQYVSSLLAPLKQLSNYVYFWA